MFTGRLKTEIPLALDALVLALEDQKDLVELDLSDNAFGPAGAKPLMRLIVNNRNIKILRLNNNGLGIEGMRRLANARYRRMAPFIAAGARLIAEALKEAHEKNVSEGKPDALEVVVFGRNRMESPGATHLAKALALYKDSLLHIQLEFLDLQDNTFTEQGSKALALALPAWPNLKHLNIGDCLLGAKGGIHVIEALTLGNTNLERIALFFNEINAKGAALVPGMLANKNALTSIELNGNVFDADSEAVQAIRDVLNRLGKEDALDELDEMEEEDEEEEEEEDEKDNESQDEEVDDLAAQLGKTKV
ncbi:hypothetical protein HDV03_003425 [Kappamyces sp. JEL0829]|nr:hypothetical protein HDV03_003425 [Kappamyces sp. JEL0829]